MYNATERQRRRKGEMLTGEQVLELRQQLRDELVWLKQHLHKCAHNDVSAVDYAVRCARVQAALDRIEKGTYGRCCGCCEPIPFLRLECVPDATMCVTCHSAGFTPSQHR